MRRAPWRRRPRGRLPHGGISGRSGARPSAEINITPLVDVVLVLLIIFMVVTPLVDRRLRVRVPDTEQAEAEAPRGEQVVVGVARSGRLLLGGVQVEDAEYVERLRRAVASRPPGERIVFFAADDEAPYQRLVTALDGGRRAGAEVLTVTTEPTAVR